MKVLVTGSSGLVGSEAIAHFDLRGHDVIGIDNNMRADLFGSDASTAGNLERLLTQHPRFRSLDADIRDRRLMFEVFEAERPDAVVHCAAQPSHDLAATRPFDDFEINAGGTLNLLEATRRYSLEAPFIFMSTNKVYGDAPNELPLQELDTRWEYRLPEHRDGIDETMRVDQSLHSLFGVSKVAADLMVQEYGRYFGMATVCFRGGCLTGARHAGVALHGYLSNLVKTAARESQFYIIGHKGKQVRDQLHSRDVVSAMQLFLDSPRPGCVYNLGGGRANSVSVLESIARVEERMGKDIDARYVNESRLGDHICYISDLSSFRNDYPTWTITTRLDAIFDELVESELARVQSQKTAGASVPESGLETREH